MDQVRQLHVEMTPVPDSSHGIEIGFGTKHFGKLLLLFETLPDL